MYISACVNIIINYAVNIWTFLLKDKCLTRENDEMKEIFLQDFNKNPEEMLRKIEPEPVAAASLAQVLKIQNVHTCTRNFIVAIKF